MPTAALLEIGGALLEEELGSLESLSP